MECDRVNCEEAERQLRDPQGYGDFRREGARPATAAIVAFIEEHRELFSVGSSQLPDHPLEMSNRKVMASIAIARHPVTYC